MLVDPHPRRGVAGEDDGEALRTPASVTAWATSSVTSTNSRWRSVCTVSTRVIVRKGQDERGRGAPGALRPGARSGGGLGACRPPSGAARAAVTHHCHSVSRSRS